MPWYSLIPVLADGYIERRRGELLKKDAAFCKGILSLALWRIMGRNFPIQARWEHATGIG
jgi:hypothetical protein